MERGKNKISRGTALFCLLCLVILMGAISGGCSRKVYIPVENDRVLTDTLFRTRWRIDTVINSDTVKMEQRGDTVVLSSVKWRTRYRVLSDTVYRSRTDSVYIEKPVIVEKEVIKNRLNFWQKALAWIGGVTLVIALGFIIAKFKRI